MVTLCNVSKLCKSWLDVTHGRPTVTDDEAASNARPAPGIPLRSARSVTAIVAASEHRAGRPHDPLDAW
jgi:hypothetical protein